MLANVEKDLLAPSELTLKRDNTIEEISDSLRTKHIHRPFVGHYQLPKYSLKEGWVLFLGILRNLAITD